MANHADKRSVSTDALATLGTIIDDRQKRDAIHLAVIPAVAAEWLRPGQHVKLMPDGTAQRVAHPKDGTGIVDPFLLQDVEVGQRFWFVIYPRVITSLRHVWSHPAIADELHAGAAAPVVAQDQKAISEAWLRQYAKRVNPYLADNGDEAYTTLMDDLRTGRLTYHGVDMHSQGELLDADELQHHASIVLGRQVNWGEFEYFSCTC